MAMTDIDSILHRIRSWASRHGRKAMLSRETGLHVTTLAKMNRSDWNPDANMIRQLDAAVTKFQAEQPDTSLPRD